MKIYEFAIEYSVGSQFVEVAGKDEQSARKHLWDDILTDEQKDNLSSIDMVDERPAPSCWEKS